MLTDKNASPLPCFIIFAFAVISIPSLYSSPDWVVVALSIGIIVWQAYLTLRYFVLQFVTGDLLIRIPSNRQLPRVIIGVILAAASAAIHVIEPSKSLSIIKTYSIELLFVALAIFSLIDVFRYTEIRGNGILHESGAFYHWKDIESLDWVGTEDKLSVQLRNIRPWKKNQIPVNSSYRKQISDSFAQYKRNNYAG